MSIVLYQNLMHRMVSSILLIFLSHYRLGGTFQLPSYGAEGLFLSKLDIMLVLCLFWSVSSLSIHINMILSTSYFAVNT